MSYRICIKSGGTDQTRISAQNMLSCCLTCGNGCNGGYPSAAWNHWKNQGVATGWLYNDKKWCDPYVFPLVITSQDPMDLAEAPSPPPSVWNPAPMEMPGTSLPTKPQASMECPLRLPRSRLRSWPTDPLKLPSPSTTTSSATRAESTTTPLEVLWEVTQWRWWDGSWERNSLLEDR